VAPPTTFQLVGPLLSAAPLFHRRIETFSDAYIISIIGTSIFTSAGPSSPPHSPPFYGPLLLRFIADPPRTTGVRYDANVFYTDPLHTFYIVAFLSRLIAEELRKKKKG
jgi:hypothetical protein